MTSVEKTNATLKILELARMNPLSQLAWNLHNCGYSASDINALMRNNKLRILPDPFKNCIVNALSDIEYSGKVLETVRLPAIRA